MGGHQHRPPAPPHQQAPSSPEPNLLLPHHASSPPLVRCRQDPRCHRPPSRRHLPPCRRHHSRSCILPCGRRAAFRDATNRSCSVRPRPPPKSNFLMLSSSSCCYYRAAAMGLVPPLWRPRKRCSRSRRLALAVAPSPAPPRTRRRRRYARSSMVDMRVNAAEEGSTVGGRGEHDGRRRGARQANDGEQEHGWRRRGARWEEQGSAVARRRRRVAPCSPVAASVEEKGRRSQAAWRLDKGEGH
jgi:hypothetical protein